VRGQFGGCAVELRNVFLSTQAKASFGKGVDA
jgi:hypothetical protein